MRLDLSRSSLAAAVALSLIACSGQRIRDLHPDYLVDKQALSFEACPSVEGGEPVEGILPDQQTLTITNNGETSGALQLAITGPGKDRFWLVEDTLVPELGSGGSATVAVRFTPVESGPVNATLQIDDGDHTTAIVEVALSGSGTSGPIRPTVQILYPGAGTGELTACTESFGGGIDSCFVEWPEVTFIGFETTLPFKVRNTGCAPMNVTGIDIVPALGSTTPVQFFLDAPAIAPTAEAPVRLPGAGGELPVSIRFAPLREGEDDLGGPRKAVLRVRTDSANSPEALVELSSDAQFPAAYVVPSYCKFTDAEDTCNGTKVDTGPKTKMASFEVKNGGNADFTVTEVRFQQGGSGRFTVGPRSPVGKAIAPAGSEILDVTYTDDPLYVIEVLEVITDAGGGKSAGQPTISVEGGVQPCLKTNPDLALSFESSTETTTVRPLEICNDHDTREQCGELTLHSVEVTQGTEFFTVIDPPAPGTRLAHKQCLTTDVQFTRPIVGGLQTGTLEIAANDPVFGTANKRLSLYSFQPVNRVPVAECFGPNGQGPQFSVSLDLLNPKRITLCGDQSYDPPDMAPLAFYKWILGSAPNNGANFQSLSKVGTNGTVPLVSNTKYPPEDAECVDLNVDPTKGGRYKVFLVVYDETDQPSGNTCELQILVNQ